MTERKNIGAFTEEQHKMMLRNNLTNVMNNTVYNSGLNAQVGLEQTITSLTNIISKVVRTLYYTVPNKLSDYVKIEVGQGAYAQKLLQYATNIVGNEGKQGIINPTANGINKDANSSIQVGSFTLDNNFWRWTYNVSNELVNMAQVNAQTFSIIEENEIARKKIWDLMLQDAFFIGLDDGKSYGILNQPNVNVNTTVKAKKFSAMTDSEFQAFLAQVGNAYGTNNAYTMTFDTMLVPTAEFFSLTQPFGQYGLNRLQVLEDAMKRITGSNFKVLHAKYGENANANKNGGRTVLYNSNADNLCAFLPVPYTPMPLFPQGALDLISQAHGQFITPFAKRTTSMLYLDEQV